MMRARWWHEQDGDVRCDLCPHRCLLPDGATGRCGARRNVDGEMISLTYGKVCVRNVDPIEKKPIFHYRPGSMVLSLGTFGCNLRCLNCQNAALVSARVEDAHCILMSPQEVVDAAMEQGVQGIAWTFNEPTVWAEFIIDTARLAREKGLFTMVNTNGYILPPASEDLFRCVQVANIDIKGFTDTFYQEQCGGTFQEVLDACEMARRQGTHVELTCLLIPGLNDSPPEVERLARWIVESMGEETPLFFYRFRPFHRSANIPEQTMEKMEEAAAIAQSEGVSHVYFGGTVGDSHQDTLCPSCGHVVVRRRSLQVADKVCFKGGEVSRFCPTFADITVDLDGYRCPLCGGMIAFIPRRAPL
jgi:pyruvate formate lyase activating enzyme